MSNDSAIPSGWRIARLGDVCQTTSGGTPSRKVPKYYEGNVPWVKSGELKHNTILDTEEKISKEALRNSSAKLFPKGTLLIALYGATIGKLAFLGIDAATNQAVCGILKNDTLASRFLYHFLFFKRPSLVDKGIGGAQPNISQTILKSLNIPLPPLPEQHRIVEKIEALFSELEKGIEQLTTGQQQLKVYRQSVLKWAFEGRLTEEWRKSVGTYNYTSLRNDAAKMAAEPSGEYTVGTYNCTSLRDAKELLERIKQEREAQAKASGNPPNRRRAGKLRPIAPLTEKELAELPELPEGWIWIRIVETVFDTANDIVDGPFGSNLKNSDYVEGAPIPVIGITNIEEGFKKGIRYITREKFETIKRSAVYPGDIIVAKIGSTYGKTGVYPDWMPIGVIPANLLRIRPSKHYSKKLLIHYLKSRTFKKRLDGIMKSTAQPAYNVSMFKELPIPFMNVEEQHQIVQEIESRLSVCDKLEETITASLSQAEALRQSILKKAFEGRLVEQDPKDGSSAKLLSEINREKQAKQIKKAKAG